MLRKIKKELEPKLVGAKVKTVPVSILGTAERSPLELFVSASASNAPIIDNGIENKTTNGYTKLLYRATMIRYTRMIAANRAMPNEPKPSL